jgi:anaerobic C4-dicarboxylate transporter
MSPQIRIALGVFSFYAILLFFTFLKSMNEKDFIEMLFVITLLMLLCTFVIGLVLRIKKTHKSIANSLHLSSLIFLCICIVCVAWLSFMSIGGPR